MESTLADIRQLYNVKTIKYATKIEALVEGEFGVFPEGSDTSIAQAIVYSTLPEKFYLAARVGGKLMLSFDTIDKSKMRNISSKDYTAPQVNIWEATLEGCGCDCLKSASLMVHIDEANINMQNGMSWTNRDNFVEVAPKELECLCDCEGMPVYQNHLFTRILANRVNEANSPYYEAEVAIDVTGLGSSGTYPESPSKGDLYIKTGAGAGLAVYDGAAWVVIGTAAGAVTDMDTYIESTKDLNMGETAEDFTPKLKLVLKGKDQPAVDYRDLEVDYVATRGVRITPSFNINGINGGVFTETQQLGFEIGAGADIRLEEWENMNFYTDLNFNPRLLCGVPSRKLKYQFENGKTYDGVVFEFATPKVERNTGESRLFGVYLGAESGSTESTRLKAIFTP